VARIPLGLLWGCPAQSRPWNMTMWREALEEPSVSTPFTWACPTPRAEQGVQLPCLTRQAIRAGDPTNWA
jgi:hypothetical protein